MSGSHGGKEEWIKRVLGVDPANSTETASPAELGAMWRDAKEATDQALNQLAGKLQATGDPDLVRIAEYGLFGIGGGRGINVALNRALLEYGAAAPERRQNAARQVRKAVAAYRDALGGEGVRLIDSNPFGVNVAMRNRLGTALDRIEHALA